MTNLFYVLIATCVVIGLIVGLGMWFDRFLYGDIETKEIEVKT